MSNEILKAMVAVSGLNLVSAARHSLLALLVRQASGETEWMGCEGLSLDTGIPKNLIEISISSLRAKGLLKLYREIGSTHHCFRVQIKTLCLAASGTEED